MICGICMNERELSRAVDCFTAEIVVVSNSKLTYSLSC